MVSEWIKFRRTATIGAVAMIFFAGLISVFLITGGGPAGPGGGGRFGSVDLTAADGAVAGLRTALNMIGVVSLALFSLSIARDFELGTIRSLLVGQPRRGVLLFGKIAGVSVFVVVAIVVAGIAAATVTTGLAPAKDISTDAWTLSASRGVIGQVAAGGLLFGFIGAAIAMITRSAATSITIGAGYLLLFENLLGLVWSRADEWLPADILGALVDGGTADVSLARAVVLAAAYGAAALVTMFARRDVTD